MLLDILSVIVIIIFILNIIMGEESIKRMLILRKIRKEKNRKV